MLSAAAGQGGVCAGGIGGFAGIGGGWRSVRPGAVGDGGQRVGSAVTA